MNFEKVIKKIDLFRLLVLNILFFILILIIIIGIFSVKSSKSNEYSKLKNNSVLYIEPTGEILEDTAVLNEVQKSFKNYFILRQFVDTIYYAAHDTKISEIFIDFSKLENINLTQMEEIGKALKYFKEQNKIVYAFSENYNEDYYLASFSNKIFLDPMGEINIDGFSLGSLYYGDFFKKLGIEYSVFQAGHSKSSAEPYTRNNMSENVKKNYTDILNVVQTNFVNEISFNRAINKTVLNDYINNYYELLKQKEGDSALLCEDLKIIDEVAEIDTVKYLLGYEDSENKKATRNIISYVNYLPFVKTKIESSNIGVINLSGVISSSNRGNNVCNANDFIELLEKAGKNKSVNAIVVRINSGGGEVFASEKIRRAILKVNKKFEKPVVVSIASTACSGAYWIATAADSIVSNTFSVTGSIGAYMVLPSFKTILNEKLGINYDYVKTNRDKINVLNALSEENKKILSLSINRIYKQFLETVSKGRDIPLDKVASLAEGQIYSGVQAKSLELVDYVGTYKDAITIAATSAGLEKYGIIEFVSEKNFLESILDSSSLALIKDFSPLDLKILNEILMLNEEDNIYVYNPVSIFLSK